MGSIGICKLPIIIFIQVVFLLEWGMGWDALQLHVFLNKNRKEEKCSQGSVSCR